MNYVQRTIGGALASSLVDKLSVTSKRLCSIFGWKSNHGGEEFEELLDLDGHRVLWLHHLNDRGHLRFKGVKQGRLGRGLAIYVFVKDVDSVLTKVKKKRLEIVEPLHLNQNAGFNEFTFRDTSGYCFSVSEFPKW